MNESREEIDNAENYELPIRLRLASACAGALLTALVVTPFDVVKTRMQMMRSDEIGSGTSGINQSSSSWVRTAKKNWQSRSLSNVGCKISIKNEQLGALAACPRCGVFVLNNGLMEHMLSKDECRNWLRRNFGSRTRSQGVGATLNTLTYIARTEGARGLYAGIGPTLVMAVPNTALYFAAYDELRSHFDSFLPKSLAPGIAGASARIVAATAVAPFELARTQLQALSPERRFTYINELSKLIRTQGIFTSLFRGLGPTLWRDVPFSAIYWGTYDSVYTRLRTKNHTTSQRLATAFTSGLSAGALAALLTTPFDVVKTRRMVQSHIGAPSTNNLNFSTVTLLAHIARNEGPSALFSGSIPRLLKVAPACAIMIATYETAKDLFARHSASTNDFIFHRSNR
mmetsp:Transcript_23350/g.30286  ORF Transcript_23350/g.30286 Transcript_23350/m.30286 type:complete len:400 (-) Transcript_23350:883-2082(-)|eukprot:CAMPEP_0197288512 /NCGR_PEP_ID=MMETSP0890-20130614/5605_1 /TAXON_ID=44058 ORGANISM="Aureoumbra lagunensis, Strain CCMP1510" /NCGR_SAMPLE_ID=MMETSP0890 /ASSEMBLY_ACC=CAM_ASM_000533 /LENGTH=399 /DNA_ID=CAMNT_0042759277 /DNA_START=37 /DNA_END=1236 /DNA_ORIENTATION=+